MEQPPHTTEPHFRQWCWEGRGGEGGEGRGGEGREGRERREGRGGKGRGGKGREGEGRGGNYGTGLPCVKHVHHCSCSFSPQKVKGGG